MQVRRTTLLSLTATLMLIFTSLVSAQEKVTIWWPQSTSGETAQCLVDTSTPLFNEQSENYEIEWVLQPPDDSYRNLIRTAVVAGSGPDIIATDGAAFTFELASAGLMLPLNEYIEQYAWDDLIPAWALGLVEIEGNFYGIPEELESVVLYYNKTLFDTNG